MIVMAALALAAVQGPDFSWTGPLAEGRELKVRNIIGDIRVETGSGRTVEVRAVKRAGRKGTPDEVQIRRVETARGIEFCVIYPGHELREDRCDWRERPGSRSERNRNENDTRVSFTIRVPAGVSVSVGTVAGDVEVSGVRGEVDAASVSGDVVVRDATGGAVSGNTVSGDVELRNVSAREVSAHTVSGDVVFRGDIQRSGEYAFKTLSGDIDLYLPAGTNAEVNGSTFSGSLSSDFPLTGESDRSRAKRRRLEGTLGRGGAEISLESFSGSVRIREAGR